MVDVNQNNTNSLGTLNPNTTNNLGALDQTNINQNILSTLNSFGNNLNVMQPAMQMPVQLNSMIWSGQLAWQFTGSQPPVQFETNSTAFLVSNPSNESDL